MGSMIKELFDAQDLKPENSYIIERRENFGKFNIFPFFSLCGMITPTDLPSHFIAKKL